VGGRGREGNWRRRPKLRMHRVLCVHQACCPASHLPARLRSREAWASPALEPTGSPSPQAQQEETPTQAVAAALPAFEDVYAASPQLDSGGEEGGGEVLESLVDLLQGGEEPGLGGGYMARSPDLGLWKCAGCCGRWARGCRLTLAACLVRGAGMHR
jgi:hypothetical protein